MRSTEQAHSCLNCRSQIPRFEPPRINTGLTAIGNPNQTLNATALRDVELSTQLDRAALGFDKTLVRGVELQLCFRTDDRMW